MGADQREFLNDFQSIVFLFSPFQTKKLTKVGSLPDLRKYMIVRNQITIGEPGTKFC